MAEIATIIDDQGREWTGLVVERRTHPLAYLFGLIVSGGLAGESMRIPDTVTVHVAGEDHRGREKRPERPKGEGHKAA